MFLRLLLLLTIVPALELWTLFKFHDLLALNLGDQTALMVTFGIILFTGLMGAQLARRQGLKIVAEIQSNLNRGLMPGPALIDGVFILGGGALLLTPGIWTDILGLAFLLPVTRNIFRVWLIRKFMNNVTHATLIYDMDAGRKGSHFDSGTTIDIESKSETKGQRLP